MSDIVQQRLWFIEDQASGECSLAELCRQYGISRETGYKWLKRFAAGGEAGLKSQSRAPLRHPNQTAAEIEAALLELRRLHPRYGPKKLRKLAQEQTSAAPWPAASTIGALLQREGLARPRKKRRRVAPYTRPFAAADGPNCVWCADFKGWFRTRDGQRIDPLTMTDAYSRYLLRCQQVAKTDTERVQTIFEAAFREFGLPWAIRTDNGPPFASHALGGLSRLALYLIKLGIVPERIQAGHPEQNGRHERMHRTLKAETAAPPAANRRDQQAAFERFRQEYNQVRPHEALGQQTPASCYVPSPRPYPARLPVPEYPADMQVRKVHQNGDFRFQGHNHIFLSKTLIGEPIGLEQVDERYWRIYFCHLPLARFDSHTLRVVPLPANDRKEDAAEGAEEDDYADHAESARQAGAQPSP